MSSKLESRLQEMLRERLSTGLVREIRGAGALIDFSSNDYLGFAAEEQSFSGRPGAGASRLLSGHSRVFEDLEEKLCEFHRGESALVCNSGYNANVGLFSALGVKGACCLYDERVHASIRDGIRLSHGSAFKFRHNNLENLKELLEKNGAGTIVAVESVYSMDGDFAPLEKLAELCEAHEASLIVDEAHAVGVYGKCGRGRVCELGLEDNVFARVVAFGKAIGAFGAAVLGPTILRECLVNFARSVIYTTALPPTVVESVVRAYAKLEEDTSLQRKLRKKVEIFLEHCGPKTNASLLPASGPIQSIVVAGNEIVKRLALTLQLAGYDVRPILSPSVPAGSERLRIILHVHNSDRDIEQMLAVLEKELPECVASESL